MPTLRGFRWYPYFVAQEQFNSGIGGKQMTQIHKVKGFADDLTVLSSSKTEHENTLSDVNQKCNEIAWRSEQTNVSQWCLMVARRQANDAGRSF